ncbi:Aminomethyltransferase (glycine cleavage system T protein) (EC [Olavius algarvensis associated proteobacterium Delta 3]|nr:Aminomethyltransferase (glycine cleavage system T protein) (EC [Olavius algarvensis associated proteobacterium Delta 3]
MADTLKTIFLDRHKTLGGQIVEFAGWDMPIQYPDGIIQEHLATRRSAGLFDVSHMGRFTLGGTDAVPFLQHVLTNNAEALEVEEGQYTMIPNGSGGAIDDAYLYRFVEDEYLLVVNASNRLKNWEHFRKELPAFKEVELRDRTTELVMLSLQGPLAKDVLQGSLSGGRIPEPMRNSLSTAEINGGKVLISRTGYTGEPICFELFIENGNALAAWDLLVEKGATPIGLGARDTLRLEAGLPLYGHELGLDPDETEIPIFACPLARFAVSFSPLKGNFVGKAALETQFKAFKRIMDRDFSLMADLPRIVQPIALVDKGIARAGAKVFTNDRHVGYVTSGTMVPYWKTDGVGLSSSFTGDYGRRAIGLGLLDSDLVEGDEIDIDIRGKRAKAVIVPYHLRNEAPPYARPVLHSELREEKQEICATDEMAENVKTLVDKAVANHTWRQTECINLIPSEQTSSTLTRLLSITDPIGRYAEHKPVKAFKEADVFYYQGTDFICEVEYLLKCEFQKYLGCEEVETRVVSGQMANTAVFSAMVDYLNRADRKSEQRRIRKVMNNHIIKGGHLSAQPMGALRDFVVRDPKWEKPAVVNFPVHEDNPYKIDVEAAGELAAEHRPELIILGKSMTIHHEPVEAMRKIIEDLQLECILMYDMAHVLGLIGPYFQEPFKEGADIVTGSTHKTFFGTQRGVVGVNFKEDDVRYALWEAIQRRSFPGSLSNHHLGTLVGLLLSAYEMNTFKDAYQKGIIDNAKAFAAALVDAGLSVAGDPSISYTETHQVILNVGYGKGPMVARKLEENNIILNYQAAPEEEGFTASGSLRMGVQEMTRFGMTENDFQELAQLMADVILQGKTVKDEVAKLRSRFLEMQYCFSGDEIDACVEKLQKVL